MSETDTGRADETTAAHAPDDAHHDDGHGASAAEPLGPVDVQAWTAAIIGGSIGIVLVLVLLVTIGDF